MKDLLAFFWLCLVGMVIAFVIMIAVANAETLSWTPPTTNADGTPLTDLSYYNVRQSLFPGSYVWTPVKVNAPASSYQLAPLSPGSHYYFVVTAVDTSGNESVYSNEADYLAPVPTTTPSPSPSPSPAPTPDTCAPMVAENEYLRALAYHPNGQSFCAHWQAAGETVLELWDGRIPPGGLDGTPFPFPIESIPCEE